MIFEHLSLYHIFTKIKHIISLMGILYYLLVRNKLNGHDPYKWAKDYIYLLNKKEQEASRKVIIHREQSKLITKNARHSYNGGYLFLQ